ncbi:MAG: hypothetical protein RL199_929 [Pseudomonadota bacterium]|jgi:hypothetical protein
MGRPAEALPHRDGRPTASSLAPSGLSTQVEVHDSQQLEIRFHYALGSDEGPQRYTVDTYFFIPRNVGVNASNFTKDVFYGDVTALMRLDAAPLPLDQLADERLPASPLSRFAEAVEAFRTEPRPPPSRPVAVHVKLYAHLFAVAARRELGLLVRMAKDPAQAEALERELLATLGRIRLALDAYRRVRAAFWPFEKLCDEGLVEAMRGADEHMSLLVEERLAQVVDAVDALAPRSGASGLAARVRLCVSRTAREEAAYRRRYGYLTLVAEEASGEGEYFTYRASLLKKSVQQALYLDPREVKVDRFLQNAAGAVAAALGAIWATALAMQLPMNPVDLPADAKALFFALAVGAYVTKDRIKAYTSEWLGRRLRRHDHVSWLYGESLETVGLGMLRARYQELVRFIKEAEAPDEVRRMRLSHRTVQRAERLHEEVVHYRKTLELGTFDEAGRLPDGYRLRDILRLNVRHFLVRLDDPYDQVAYFDAATGGFAHARLPKVYHLNVVLQVTRELADGTRHARLEHLRVVLNKEGIVRVETVETEGPRAIPSAPRRLRLPIRLRVPFLRR